MVEKKPQSNRKNTWVDMPLPKTNDPEMAQKLVALGLKLEDVYEERTEEQVRLLAEKLAEWDRLWGDLPETKPNAWVNTPLFGLPSSEDSSDTST